jgi:hypothetical protein
MILENIGIIILLVRLSINIIFILSPLTMGYCTDLITWLFDVEFLAQINYDQGKSYPVDHDDFYTKCICAVEGKESLLKISGSITKDLSLKFDDKSYMYFTGSGTDYINEIFQGIGRGTDYISAIFQDISRGIGRGIDYISEPIHCCSGSNN